MISLNQKNGCVTEKGYFVTVGALREWRQLTATFPFV